MPTPDKKTPEPQPVTLVPPTATPTAFPKNIPVSEEPTNIPSVPGDSPKNEEFKGLYTNKGDGEEYALAVKEDAHDGRTHWAKNTRHTWNGTKAEFVDQFEKK